MRWLVASIVVVAAGMTADRAEANSTVAAQVHLDRGVAAFRAGDYTLAHRELSLAHELAPDKPNPYRWLALTEVQLGDCRRALANIEGFISRVTPDDARIAEIVRLRELCQRTGVLRVESSPSSASLRIDGAVVGTTPYSALSIRAGSHLVVAEKRGFRTASRSIVVPMGGELAVRLDLASARRPLATRWWFWTAIAATAVTAAGIAIVVSRDDGTTLLPPIRCNNAGCAPGGS